MSEKEAQYEINTRNLALDVIRGLAVLGMIFINILVFVPDINELTWRDPLSGETSPDGTIYQVIYVLFNGKMRALFALLFGVGIIIFFQTSTANTINKSDLFARRMLWLLIFGLIHAYFLLWPGTILFEYALCGFLLFSLRVLSPGKLIALSLIVLAYYTYLNSKDFDRSYQNYKGYEKAMQLISAKQNVPEDLLKKKNKFEKYLENHAPFSEAKKEELAADKTQKIELYRSGLPAIYKQNTGTANEALSFGVYLNILESIGTMLLGMALYKFGFFGLRLKKYVYYLVLLIGIPLGITLYLLLFKWQVQTKNELLALYAWKNFSSFSVEALARILLSLGYCALLLLLCQLRSLKPALSIIANVGRMAFSNYVTQSVIFLFFFYVLQYYGVYGLGGLSKLALGILLFQLIASYFCIRYFGTGPLELVWRKLANRKLQNDLS